ncbi:MAG: ubiquinol-cytochrome c reductase core subunit 1 [Peltula sp. TS41687]|nr:MAG: ubiquinol-cytochrome c reductase core subunit 1 [Peltula sp. TS41687]
MIWRWLIRHNAKSGSGQASSSSLTRLSHRRGLATPASGTFQYHVSDVEGVKIASRDLPGPVTTLGLVAKAGTRYQILPGFAEGLEKFAFMSTEKRSALRITREVELLGAKFIAYHSRENLVIGAKFMRDDLPYFVELLGDVATKTRYTRHEFDEEIYPAIKLSQKKLLANTQEMAINSAHGVAFHRGLGEPLHPTSSTPLNKYLNANNIQAYASAAYIKPNIALVANGATPEDLSKWVPDFFSDAPTSIPAPMPKLEPKPTKYHGGEERIAHASGDTMIIGFPGSSSFTAGSSYKPEISVLATLLGGEPNIKWSSGFSLLAKTAASHPGAKAFTSHAAYSDAGLLYITLTGSAMAIREMSKEVVRCLKSVAAGEVQKEEMQKAIARAKFQALEAGESLEAGLESTGAGLIQGGSAFQMDEVAKRIDGVTADQIKKAAKTLLDGKASVSAVGDLYILPFAEEIGLNV